MLSGAHEAVSFQFLFKFGGKTNTTVLTTYYMLVYTTYIRTCVTPRAGGPTVSAVMSPAWVLLVFTQPGHKAHSVICFMGEAPRKAECPHPHPQSAWALPAILAAALPP